MSERISESPNFVDLVENVKEKIRVAIDETVVTTRRMPIRPWRDTTERSVDDMVITSDQLIIVVPSEVWSDLIYEVTPILELLVSQVVAAEDRAQIEWTRGRELEERLRMTEDKISGWRTVAEDANGILFSKRAETAEARILELEKALSFYADKENWKPEPRITESGVSINDRGGIARAALEVKK